MASRNAFELAVRGSDVQVVGGGVFAAAGVGSGNLRVGASYSEGGGRTRSVIKRPHRTHACLVDTIRFFSKNRDREVPL